MEPSPCCWMPGSPPSPPYRDSSQQCIALKREPSSQSRSIWICTMQWNGFLGGKTLRTTWTLSHQDEWKFLPLKSKQHWWWFWRWWCGLVFRTSSDDANVISYDGDGDDSDEDEEGEAGDAITGWTSGRYHESTTSLAPPQLKWDDVKLWAYY